MILDESNVFGAATVAGDQIINESILLDEDIEFSDSDMIKLIQENLLSERTIVKLDKQAKRTHAINKSAFVCAKEANDPLYKKLVFALKLKKKCKDAILKKYSSKGKARYMKNLQTLKASPTVKKVANSSKKSTILKSTDVKGNSNK